MVGPGKRSANARRNTLGGCIESGSRYLAARNINNKSFRLLSRANDEPLGEEKRETAYNCARFVFVMNAPLSSGESIIAGRFCPRGVFRRRTVCEL